MNPYEESYSLRITVLGRDRSNINNNGDFVNNIKEHNVARILSSWHILYSFLSRLVMASSTYGGGLEGLKLNVAIKFQILDV